MTHLDLPDSPKSPPDRRPSQPLSRPSGTRQITYADGRRQLWRQYGWIDHLGRMYDLSENPRHYRVASYRPLWVLVDNEPDYLDEPEPRRPWWRSLWPRKRGER